MKIDNRTQYSVGDLFEAALDGHDHGDLAVQITYCPRNSSRYISGTYYRQCPRSPDGKYIKLRINRNNKYPVSAAFKTSDYYTRVDKQGREVIYQKFRRERFGTAEHLLVAIFLHEFSHYMDHMEGRNGRFKQTKADKFAVERLRALGLIRR
jgi:hypothetical protein